MKARLINVGEKILEFLKATEGCEDAVFDTKYMDTSIGAYIDFRWLEHHFYMRFEQRGGGIRLGEVAKHGWLRDAEVKEDTADIPFLDINGFGSVGRVPSQCFIDICLVHKGAGKGGRDKYERVLWFENPSEVHLLPPECVQKLDEILVRDVVNFLRWHFGAWKDGGINLKNLYHPRACY